MASAPLPSDPLHVPFRRRAAGLALALAANLLLLALLLGLVPVLPGPPPAGRGPTVITLSPDAAESPSPSESPASETRAAKAAPERARTPAAPQPVPPPPVPAEPDRPLPMILLTPDEFASADIGRMPKRGAAEGTESADAGAGAASMGKGSDGSIGVGPNGERLYRADWVREPTDAELATYLPRDAPGGGYGVVACRTVARNRVEDCAEVAESPAGSGYARSVRLAAWQFLVRPPRVGGRTLVGAWVQIRITYSRRKAD
ncbi:hypothetical protein [Sphingomonas jatrophae]|uniref:Protein TonB n=1 Tax=Sphingomonas jatrophae TaxID=1166337 RepID=A0A1I6M3A9_9SPHN|nr:hypothetical protein [Sphingomonas jatrophae]SFS10144.1 protein TonB [Sphingomonas jatrophae]